MPGEFVDGGSDHLDSAPTENALAELVSENPWTCPRSARRACPGRGGELAGDPGADPDEAKFCVAAGRMGVDPYDPSQMNDDLAGFIESALDDPDQPLAHDLTEAAEADAIAGQWSWVQRTTEALHLGPMPRPPAIPAPPVGLSPSRHGYRLAAVVRELAGLGPAQPVQSIDAVAQRLAGASFQVQEQNHLPGRNVRAVVGWTGDHEMLLVGPRPLRPDAQRFLAARGLYHALFTCDRSHRLVTRAYTWDQQASRSVRRRIPRTAHGAHPAGTRQGRSRDRRPIGARVRHEPEGDREPA